MRRLCFAVCLLVFFSFPSFSDEGQHHEDLTPEQLGTVHFPVSCAAAMQKPFERGIALLHSFWYEEAQKQFEQIAKDDPSCAMAHWGVGMSLWHELWDFPKAETTKHGRAEMKQAKALRPKTDRERDYIAALTAFYNGKGQNARTSSYSQAMERVNQKYPDDREAATFYALSLLAGEDYTDKTFATNKKAAAVLEKLFAEEPNHPGVAHYLIHSYDKPQLAQLGLPAARRYAQIAPAAPHALHMPSHIFARLGLWQDDIQSNLASIAATRKTAAMHMGGEGHQFHALDYLLYAYMQSGHEAEGAKMIEEIKAMPPMKDMYDRDSDMRAYALAISEARYNLELHHWKDAAAMEPVPSADHEDRGVFYFARAIGAARSGNLAQAQSDVQQLESNRAALVKEKKNGQADTTDQYRKIAQAWLDHANGKDDQGLAVLRAIADTEDSTGERSDLGIPVREMVADMLLEMKRPEQALAEYEAELKLYPNRFNGLYGAGQAAEATGKTESAGRYYAQLVKICDGSGSERPELALAKKNSESERSAGAQ
jgi:tetratricopeptide repeat protein